MRWQNTNSSIFDDLIDDGDRSTGYFVSAWTHNTYVTAHIRLSHGPEEYERVQFDTKEEAKRYAETVYLLTRKQGDYS